MADEPNNAADAAAGATTPAPAEPAASVSAPEKPQIPDISADEPWAGFGEEKEPDKAEETKSAEPDGKKEEEKKAGEKEPDLEDEIVKEAFGEEEDSDESKKSEPGKPTEEDLDKKDPTEMIAAQRNATAKAWAERAERVYKPTRDFKHGSLPVADFHDRLGDFLGEDRAGEFASYEAHRLVDENPEGAFHRIYALKMLARDPNWEYAADKVPKLDDLVSGKLAPVSEAEPKTVATAYDARSIPAGELAEATKALDKVIDWDWRDPANDDQFVDEREKGMAQTIRTLEAAAKAATAKEGELTEKLTNLSKTVEGLTTNQQTEEQKKLKAESDVLINEFKQSIEDKMMPLIKKRTGLEIREDDTDDVKDFKARRLELYTGTAEQKKNNWSSDFEDYAFNHSSVKQDLLAASEKFVGLKVKQAAAHLADDKAAAKKFRDEADEFRITFYQLFGKAEKEFTKRFVEPDIRLLGLNARAQVDPIMEAAKRRETVATGGGITTTKKPTRQYETADELWDAMPGEAAEEERQQRAA